MISPIFTLLEYLRLILVLVDGFCPLEDTWTVLQSLNRASIPQCIHTPRSRYSDICNTGSTDKPVCSTLAFPGNPDHSTQKFWLFFTKASWRRRQTYRALRCERVCRWLSRQRWNLRRRGGGHHHPEPWGSYTPPQKRTPGNHCSCSNIRGFLPYEMRWRLCQMRTVSFCSASGRPGLSTASFWGNKCHRGRLPAAF